MKRVMVYRWLIGILLLIVGAFVGLIVGMNIGGNYFSTFQLWTWTGYEATGMLGLFVGGVLGGLSGLLLGRKILRNRI